MADINLYAGYEGSFDGELDVARVTKEPFVKVAERTDILSGYNLLASDGKYLYDALGWDWEHVGESRIYKLNLHTLATVGTIAFNQVYIWSIAEKGNYIYVGMSGTGKIIRCTKTPFAKDAELNVGEGVVGTLIIDGDTMYCITALAGCPPNDKVVKIDLPTFTKGAVLDLGQCINDFLSADAVISGGFLYVGTPRSPAKIVKIDLSSFTVDSTLTLSAGNSEARGLVVKDGFLYIGCYTSPARVVKISLATFTEVTTLILTDGNIAFDMGIYENVLCVQLYYYRIVRVDLSTFTKIDVLHLGSDAWCATDLIIVDVDKYKNVTIANAGGTSDCCIIEHGERQACKVAVRGVPLRTAGSFVDTGTWTLKNRRLHITIRLTDAEKTTFQDIFEATAMVTIIMRTTAAEYPRWTYTGWFVKKPLVYEYSKDGDGNIREWVVEIEFVLSSLSYSP